MGLQKCGLNLNNVSKELEIIYIESGQIRVKIPQRSFLLKKGDCLAINANIVHYAAAAPEGSLHSLVFSPALISGNKDSVFAQKYMSPLKTCPASVFSCIRRLHHRWI